MIKKIGIDVYTALHSPRGMGMYVIFFLKELADIDKKNQYILYGDVEDINKLLPQQENFIYKKLNSKSLFYYEQIALPKQVKKDKIDILHSPANTSPIFLNKKIKRIITQHDIIFLKKEVPFPNNKKQLLGRIYYILCTIANLKKADKIFTVSNFSKNDIIKTFHINNNKLVLTPNGHEHFDTSKATEFNILKEKYNIPDSYYFTLGGEAPSKNTEILLKLFSKNNKKSLVIAGIKHLENSILYNKYKDFKNIKFVPYIDQTDLVGIYKNAKAFIFPSIYEGFGIPLLEAMKCSTPILCSNVTCLPEVAGKAALYFDPKNIGSILEKIHLLDEKPDIRLNLLKNAKTQAKKYSWKFTALKIKEVYNIL